MSLSDLITNTRAAISSDPKKGQATFRAQHELVGVTKVAVNVGSFQFNADEPASLGGDGSAPNPVEYALASLGTCQAITYRFWAERLGIAFDTLNVDVEGDIDFRGFFDIDDQIRPGFGAVRVEVKISGPETPERYQELAKAVNEHCPVGDVFANPVSVDYSLNIG